MKVVVDIGHPAHVHLFRHLINALELKGHSVLITSTDKDIAFRLLDEFNYEYVKLGSTGKTLFRKILSVPVLDYRFLKAVKEFEPDLLIGHGSFRCSHISKLINKPSLILTDSEITFKERMMYIPLATLVATPKSFQLRFGKKHIRYDGFHELAYLHPNRFIPDKNVLGELGLEEGEKFFILRFVAWDATHDIGHHGFSYEGRKALINILKQHGRVMITSEKPLPYEFERYRFSLKPSQMHDALNFASMYIGEGATMATEAAVLGTPSVYLSTLHHGVHQELVDKYKLLMQFSEEKQALGKIEEALGDDSLKLKWQQRRELLIKEKVDLTQWLLELIKRKWLKPASKEALVQT